MLHAGGEVPAGTVSLFARLLEALDKGQSGDALQPHLYAALLSFMQYTPGLRPAQASPHILSALSAAGGSPDCCYAGRDACSPANIQILKLSQESSWTSMSCYVLNVSCM